MQLITSRNNDCVAASIAMLLDLTLEEIKSNYLFGGDYLTYPFPYPWEELPKVPSMVEVCEMLWGNLKIGLVPFPFNPYCKPHHDCGAVRVYLDSQEALHRQMRYGPGLLEGMVTTTAKGHMCAWDGENIFDPRGREYPLDRQKLNRFQINQFWLKVN